VEKVERLSILFAFDVCTEVIHTSASCLGCYALSSVRSEGQALAFLDVTPRDFVFINFNWFGEYTSKMVIFRKVISLINFVINT
jgi:hypothetical protein